ncbi:MAG: hypothetical protein ACLQDY_01195 [Streptosporangiaceae bacterium]
MADLRLSGSRDGDQEAADAPAPDASAPGGATQDAAGPGPAGPAAPASGTGPVARVARRAAAEVTPSALWHRHRLFTIAVLIGLVPRVLAVLAFRPALLTADSFLYMQEAVSHSLGTIRPSGYSGFLALMQFLPHPLLFVTIAQHLMGIAVAVIVYALLRYWGLPGWGATLAALPVLADTRQVALESYILPDTLFCLVLMVVVALLLTRATPRRWQCVTAGLLMAYVTVLRGNGLPLAVIVAVFLLIRRVGWRSLAAAAAAFAIPVLGYVLVFHSEHGQFNLTDSDGMFLWSRTTSFANCAVIKPPPSLAPLCPDRQPAFRAAAPPAWSVSALLTEPTPADYLWSPGAWWRHDAHPGVDADNNSLGMRFALRAIEAQPLDYLKVSARDVLLTFLATDRPQSHVTMTFTVAPHIARLPSYYARDIQQYAGTTENTHPVYPYAYFLFLWQQPVYFPGVLFLAVLLAATGGVLWRWRRQGRLAALPWALAVVSVLSPALLTQSLYRYAMVAVPLSCLSVGLLFSRPRAAAAVAAATGGQDSAGQDSAGQDSAAEPATPDG